MRPFLVIFTQYAIFIDFHQIVITKMPSSFRKIIDAKSCPEKGRKFCYGDFRISNHKFNLLIKFWTLSNVLLTTFFLLFWEIFKNDVPCCSLNALIKNLRKKLPKIKVEGEWKHKVFSSSESRIKESMERKYTLLKLFPTFALTNEVSGLSNEPWELQRRSNNTGY